VTGETSGQRLAREELLEMQSLSADRPMDLRVAATGAVMDGWLPIEVSLNCADIPVRPGGQPLANREHAILLIPAHFPFSRPGVEVSHDRFAGLPYVLLGHQICLYHSDSDWDPADGMFGLIARLAAWYWVPRRAAWWKRDRHCTLRSRIRSSATPTAWSSIPTCRTTSSRPRRCWSAVTPGASTWWSGCGPRY
jgi:hypothetical protein